MPRAQVIYVDIDDTLIRSVGTSQIPIPSAIEFVKRKSEEGHDLYCWSRGGAEYAKKIASTLGIENCFLAFLPKPDLVLDDRGSELLGYCQFVLPLNAANY